MFLQEPEGGQIIARRNDCHGVALMERGQHFRYTGDNRQHARGAAGGAAFQKARNERVNSQAVGKFEHRVARAFGHHDKLAGNPGCFLFAQQKAQRP
jgi:hypothetical protein